MDWLVVWLRCHRSAKNLVVRYIRLTAVKVVPAATGWSPVKVLPLKRGTLNVMMIPVSLVFCAFQTSTTAAAQISVTDFSSIQAAIDANPQRRLFVPAGDHIIDTKLRITGGGSGLSGPGRIIQTSPDQPIIEIEHAHDIQICGVTLTRPDEKTDTGTEGILASDCRDLVIDNVQVINNRTNSAAIRLRHCTGSRISHCVIRNYSRISIDDRTANTEMYGYAFRCIDGTGIGVSESTGTLIESNRIEETFLRPTKEVQDKFQLGKFVKKNDTRPPLMNPAVWEAEYVSNWHQGSAIAVTSPEVSRHTRIIGNHIQNAAQGIDLHCDQVIVSQNIVDNAFVGMKAMHGSSNVLITGNQFSRIDLWAIGLMPGAASHPNNIDGGSVISNNIISEFGHGDAHWIWGDDHSPFKFDAGQAADDPPLTDVLIQGNVVHAVGKPRYQYAVIVEHGPTAPRQLHFSGNLFPPGTSGIANQELKP